MTTLKSAIRLEIEKQLGRTAFAVFPDKRKYGWRVKFAFSDVRFQNGKIISFKIPVNALREIAKWPNVISIESIYLYGFGAGVRYLAIIVKLSQMPSKIQF